MAHLARECRRLCLKLRHLLRHGTWQPYGRTYRVRKPSILRQRPDLEITSPLEFLAAHLGKPAHEFFFLQIGAFDGRFDEPMNSLIRRQGWRGILVEPQAEAFARLQETYADQRQLQFRNVAIGPHDGEATIYSLRRGDTQIASFDYAHLLRHVQRPQDIVARRVRCLTLETLLREEGCSHVDLLQIDAEGFDAEIIRSIDFRSCRPAIIRYEHANLLEQDRNDCIVRLAEQGYRVLLEDADTIAYLQGSGSRQPGAAMEEEASIRAQAPACPPAFA